MEYYYASDNEQYSFSKILLENDNVYTKSHVTYLINIITQYMQIFIVLNIKRLFLDY